MPSVLFVCTGNICRSPMAEGIFRAMCTRREIGADWLVDSAGVYARSGDPPAADAIAVADTYGADISGLRSRPFSNSDFARFEWIVAMDRGHLDFLEATAPADNAGVLGLLENAEGRRLEVEDPYGRPVAAYRRAGRLIAAGVENLLDRLAAVP